MINPHHAYRNTIKSSHLGAQCTFERNHCRKLATIGNQIPRPIHTGSNSGLNQTHSPRLCSRTMRTTAPGTGRHQCRPEGGTDNGPSLSKTVISLCRLDRGRLASYTQGRCGSWWGAQSYSSETEQPRSGEGRVMVQSVGYCRGSIQNRLLPPP